MKKLLFKEGQRLITSLTWACCLTVLALVAKSSVERDWTNSVDEIVAMIVVLKKSEALRNRAEHPKAFNSTKKEHSQQELECE